MNATQYSAMCVQRMDDLLTDPERHTAHFSEDCLYLNVFSPTPVSSLPPILTVTRYSTNTQMTPIR